MKPQQSMSPKKFKRKTGKSYKSDGLLTGFVVGESHADPTKVPRFSDKMRLWEKFCSLTDLPIYAHKTETFGRRQYLKKAKALCKSSGNSAMRMIEDDIKSGTFSHTM